jgi:AcrR family transcriptional regulator
MPEEPPDDIMDAAYRALCDHGYADVTMQAIADEADRSTAALHYHYDTKHDLLVAFLDHLYDRFADRLDAADEGDPVERLLGVVDAVATPPDDADRRFATAVLEIKAQAPYDDDFRDRLAEFDRLLHDRLRDAIADGVDARVLDPGVDPDDAAGFVVTTLNGARVRSVAVGHDRADTRRRLHDYVESQLVADANAEGRE